MTLPLIGVDTSVAIPLLLTTHPSHRTVSAWWSGRPVALSGHALAETYSVLTRLPGDVRASPDDAVRLIRHQFGAPLTLSAKSWRQLPELLAELQVSGGAVYDAIVALAAKENGCALATRDARARDTYDALSVTIEVIS